MFVTTLCMYFARHAEIAKGRQTCHGAFVSITADRFVRVEKLDVFSGLERCRYELANTANLPAQPERIYKRRGSLLKRDGVSAFYVHETLFGYSIGSRVYQVLHVAFLIGLVCKLARILLGRCPNQCLRLFTQLQLSPFFCYLRKPRTFV